MCDFGAVKAVAGSTSFFVGRKGREQTVEQVVR